MSEAIKVMVHVESDDVADVLAWYGDDSAGHTFNPVNARWLNAYDSAEGSRRTELWQAMSPSLQWAVHELEQRGADHVRAVLADAGAAL